VAVHSELHADKAADGDSAQELIAAVDGWAGEQHDTWTVLEEVAAARFRGRSWPAMVRHRVRSRVASRLLAVDGA
jgi:hypothetical protein